MKKHLIIMFFSCLMMPVFAQQPFRLYMAAGRSELIGDGDDYTTLVMTARGVDGEIMQNINGDIAVRTNAGLLDVSTLKMQNGVAMVKYTAPILGQPVKASQRMMLFLVKIVQKLIGKSSGSTDFEANKKNAADASSETIKEGINPFVLTVKDEKNAFAYFVCEMNGVKGKAKIHILKAAEGGNVSILPGIYHGYDITGQAEFTLEVSGGGFGRMKQGGTEANTILFTNEQATEFNNAMVKMLGGGGFMNAYLGLGASELKYLPDYNIKKMGIGTCYLPMPDNGIFLYVPPILFEYGGRTTLSNTASNTATNAPTTSSAYEPAKQEPKETVGITCEPLPVIGDGRSKVKVKFEYKDEKGVPLAGKNLQWSFPKEFTVLSQETVTNADGIANAELQAPVIKGGEWKTSDITNWDFISDNTSTFLITAYFDTPKKQKQSTSTQITVYKTREAKVHIVKPGFEEGPFTVFLPNVEFYKLQGSIYTIIKTYGLLEKTDKYSVNDAVIAVERTKFEQGSFTSAIQDRNLSRKDLISRLQRCGVFFAFTDPQGNFSIANDTRETQLFKMEPIEVKISDLTGRRAGTLVEALSMLSGGNDASGNIPQQNNTFSGQMTGILDYKQMVLNQISDMEAMLCSRSYHDAMGVDEKMHLIGMLMTNAKSTSQLMEDTGKELIGHAWSILYMTLEMAYEEYKVTDKLFKLGGDRWDKLDLKLASAISGTDRKTGVKRLIRKKISTLLTNTPGAEKVKASAGYYRIIGNLKETVKGGVLNRIIDAISEACSKVNPVPDELVAVLKGYYYADLRAEVDLLISQSPEKVHVVYSRLQPQLRDYSTDIRSHYLSIASHRFNMEMRKAEWDLLREVVIKGGVMVYDIQTCNWLKIKAHLQALDEINKLTDAAYEGTGLLLELRRYNYLWCEAKAGFTVANNCITNGVVTTSLLPDMQGFSLFSTAMAASAPPSLPAAGTGNLTGVDFSIQGGQVPVESINKAMYTLDAYYQWIEINVQQDVRLIGYKPALAGDVYTNGNAFENKLTFLLASALAYSVENTDECMQDYLQTAVQLQKTASSLSVSIGKAQEEIKSLPENVKIELPEAPDHGELQLWRNPLYIKSGIGLLIFLVIVIVTVFVLRRRNHQKSKLQKGKKTQVLHTATNQFTSPPQAQKTSIHNPPQTETPPSVQSSHRVTPKFCPQCGVHFKPGAKFCGKCGFKSV